jgi:alkylation response protein AidB-like acyl-CoA dehydrogenase
MDFNVTDELAAHREKARRWADEHLDPAWAEYERTTGTHHIAELHRLLADQGWLGAGWPTEYGGTDNDAALAQAIFEEIRARHVLVEGWGATSLIANTLLHVGTEEQKELFIGGALRGETVIALGYTEPDSGSDVAAAKTRAVRDGDEWIINGQKMFTSTAQKSTHVFLLTRTSTDKPKHRGLTMFIVPLDDPGVSIQPIHTLGGQRTNATFYTDVRVPDSARIGGVDEGWPVMKVALVYERRGGGGGGSATARLLDEVAAWSQSTSREDGSSVFSDATVQQRLARAAIDAEVARLLALRVRWVQESGGLPGVEGSSAKLFGTESAQRAHWDLLDIIGDHAVLRREASSAPLGAAVEEAFRAGVVTTIYGGASEIMREIVAERTLGLPRTRA